MKWAILVLVFSIQLSAAEQRNVDNRWDVGLAMQYLVPDRLADFEIPISAFGLRFGVPLGPNTIDIQGVYGGSDTISLYLVEASYRLNIPTPFLNAFLFGGIHHMHYGYLKRDQSLFGPQTGFGFYLPMAKDFQMGLGMKIYLTRKVMLTFGGSFAFLL